MHKLSNQKLLTIWDNNHLQPLVLQVLNLLAVAKPERSIEAWFDVSVGQRNFYLLQLHAQLFGQQMDCLTDCPACKETLEFNLNIQALCANFPEHAYAEQYEFLLEDYQITYRLINSRDLLLSSQQSNVDQAHLALLQRSIIKIEQADQLIEVTELPADVLQKFIEQLETNDVYAEIRLNLSCPHCEHVWLSYLDISNFLWTKIEARIKRLLNEVHILAVVYGWSETDILALTERRRKFYLDKLEN